MEDADYMGLALEQAKQALEQGEVPVGAVIVREGEVVSQGHNTRERERNALHHAEILAIDAACKRLGGWRLTGCTLYVTLEPCPMCTGALINARVDRVVFGAKDEKAGCCGTLMDLTHVNFGHHPKVTRGVREEECSGILAEFFSRMRGE